MNENADRQKRDRAVSIKLDLANGESVRELISRQSGLFVITDKNILRVKSPDELDPDLTHHDAPWEQSIYLPHGASDPFIARTILQTIKLAEIFFSQQSAKYADLVDISWEVMNSLVFLRLIKGRLEKRILEIIDIINTDIPKYTSGTSPKPLPILEYYEIEFRSFVNETRRALNKISELFLVLKNADFSGGRFHKAQEWAEQQFGANSLLAQMLKGDQRWIATWIAIRTAIEHPKRDKFIETMNFSLEPSRKIRLPTWRFVHPDFDMRRPQNLLDSFEININNVLKFFEDLQIALIDGHLPDAFTVSAEEIAEENRAPAIPFRYVFHVTTRSRL